MSENHRKLQANTGELNIECRFNFYIVIYLSCYCIYIFELATSCSQRTVSVLYYSEAVVTS